MRRVTCALVITLAVLFSPLSALAFSQTYTTEQEAVKACVGDTVVWLNIPSGIYHLKGWRWYGNTKSGGYGCRKQLDASGARIARNGQ